MRRRNFIQKTALLSGALLTHKYTSAALNFNDFPIVRVPKSERKFTSKAIEESIKHFKNKVSDKELGWLFENCFPNTLDTTVNFYTKNNKPFTYVITGDIDAMWLRDSTAQVSPYLHHLKNDKKLQQLIVGVINKQVEFIHKDPYANAFYDDENKISEWKEYDITDMKLGVHERKWEIDSLCYPIRLSYLYWKETGDSSPFDKEWEGAIALILKTFKEQQRKENAGPYSFMRTTAWATDGVPENGYGYPTKPVGLINSIFRPSDDATLFPFLIPSNLFAIVSLKQAAEICKKVKKNDILANELLSLANEVQEAINKYGIVNHPYFGEIYAFEVNGFGSFHIMDDANVPSLLSLPYLGAINQNDTVYQNTRKLILSENNPFYFKGKAGKGIGSPHTLPNNIWPISITMQGLTSTNDNEKNACIQMLKATHAGTGFMHESFDKDDPTKFTRKWFAWANTLFGEFLWKNYCS